MLNHASAATGKDGVPSQSNQRGGAHSTLRMDQQQHSVGGGASLDGIVPQVKALLARQDTLRSMLLALNAGSDAAVYASVNAELRANESRVAVLRQSMHQLKRASANSTRTVDNGLWRAATPVPQPLDHGVPHA